MSVVLVDQAVDTKLNQIELGELGEISYTESFFSFPATQSEGKTPNPVKKFSYNKREAAQTNLWMASVCNEVFVPSR